MEIHLLVTGIITIQRFTDVPFHILITNELNNHIKLVTASITRKAFEKLTYQRK